MLEGVVIRNNGKTNDSDCDKIHSSLMAYHFHSNGYVEKQPVEKQPVACEYSARYWLKLE